MPNHNQPFVVSSIGDLVVDLTVAIPHLPVEADAHQLAHKIALEPGGAGNFLLAGVRLGMEMLALGSIGDDPFGAAATEILSQEQIDTIGIVRQAGTDSTVVIVLVDDQGKHVFLGGYGIGPTIPMPESWTHLLGRSHAVFASGYTLREQRIAQAALQAMVAARELDIKVFFDPGPEMSYIPAEQRSAVLANSDVLLLTEEEIPLMTGGLPGISAIESLMFSSGPVRSEAQGPDLVCVKRGPSGCVILTAAGERFEHPGYPVPVRDTTAAGDSFAAAFIYAYLRGWAPDKVAAFANAMGAAKVKKFGSGRQVPTAEEVRAVLHEFHVPIDF